MIDFENAVYFKLKPVSADDLAPTISPIFVAGEQIVQAFKGARNSVIFTNRRIISINVQGVTDKKKDFTSLPYSKIQAFSVEAADVIDLSSALDLWFSNMGRVRFEFVSHADITVICRIISRFVLE